MKTLEMAFYYRSKNFSVIPLVPKDKKPLIPWAEYQKRYATDEELKEWFGNGSQNNIGIVTGKISGIAVIDFDTPEAVQYAREMNFPETPLVMTKKGFHAYYKYKEGIRNFQKRDNLPGTDLRGDGGYVVAPPSVHFSGCQYMWVKSKSLDDLPLAEFPEIILAKTPEDKTPLKELYRGATKGDRNTTLARLVGSWARDGLTFEECLENARLWNLKNNPPLSVKEIEQTVRSIFEKHQKERPAAMVLTRLDSLFQEPEEVTTWLVDRLLPSGGFSVLVAKPKVGKSTLARNLGLCIARNKPFLGRDVNQGAVIYLALEEKRSEVKRHFQVMGASGKEEIHIYVGGAPADAIKQIESLKPLLLIIDPLFRLTKVKDGNDYVQVTNALEPLLRLSRNTGTHVLCVHHANKMDSQDGNCVLGSQAIFGSVDTLMIMGRHEHYRTIKTIQRYGEDLEEIILGYDKTTRRLVFGGSRQEEDINLSKTAIIEFLSVQAEPVTEAVIMDGVEGKTVNKRKALREMVGKEVKRDGKGGKGDPFKYSCSLVPGICWEHENKNPETAGYPHKIKDYSCPQNSANFQEREQEFSVKNTVSNEPINLDDLGVEL